MRAAAYKAMITDSIKSNPALFANTDAQVTPDNIFGSRQTECPDSDHDS